MQKKNFKLICLSFFLLSSCQDIIEYKGQYLGSLYSGSEKEKKTVVLFFNPKSFQEQKATEVIINELKASAQPEILKFLFNENNQIKLLWQNQWHDFNITKTNPCIIGKSKLESLQICLKSDSVEISLYQNSPNENVISIKVTKTDDLSLLNTNLEYSLDDLVGRAKFINYTVMQKAQEVYRSKLGISVAYGNLLPKLNLKDVLGFLVSGPLSFVESIGNLMPFLFPSNWYKFNESKDLYLAEKKSYAALRGNEMNAVETLSYLHLRNIQISKYINDELVWLTEIQKNLEMREVVGDLPHGSSLLFSMKIGSLSLDKEQIDLFLKTENSLLAQAVAFPITKPLNIIPLAHTDNLDRSEGIKPDACLGSIITQSLETSAIDSMIKASQNQNSERQYLYLDPSSDGVLGISRPGTIRIGQTYQEELKIKKTEILSLLQKKCIDSVNERNSALQSYKTSLQYLKNAQNIKTILVQKILLEGNFSTELLLELIANSENIIKYKSQALSSEIQFLASESKINRLTLNGYYKNLEVGL